MDIIELINSGQINEAIAQIQTKAKTNVLGHYKEYNNDRKQRPSQVGQLPPKITSEQKEVPQSQIPIPFQRNIVRSAAAFLFGSPVKLSQKDNEDNNENFELLTNEWDALRLDSLLLKFCEAVKSETEASIVFFTQKKEGEDLKIKARLLTSKNGKVYPYFDAFGDMTSFAWEYTTKENGKDVYYLHLWTDETKYLFRKEKEWELANEKGKEPNFFKKIPVVYLSQENPEWWEVEDLIDTFEVSFSKFIDTNRYFASPKYKALGKMKKSIADAKVVELDVVETDKGQIVQSDLEVISWDRAPEALKLEFETTKELINGLSNTVDFEKLSKGGFGQLSGTALKLMFLGPIIKAKWSEGDYMITIMRIISILKAGLINIKKEGKSIEDLQVNVSFTSILPENLLEIIQLLSEARGGRPSISQKTALKHNPLVDNVDDEMEQMQNDERIEIGGTEQP